MVPLTLHIGLLGHLNHLHGLFVLRLAPLRECSRAVHPPEHVSHLGQARILISGQLFIPRKLPDILEASLPERLEHDVFDAHCEVFLTACVLAPLTKQEAQPALEVVILVEIGHKGHYFAAFDNCFVDLGISCSGLLD